MVYAKFSPPIVSFIPRKSPSKYFCNRVLLLQHKVVDMQVIDFPGRRPQVVKTEENKLELGPMRFTCDCGCVSQFSMTGAIFRYLDFFCSSCGTHYKIINPAFNTHKNKPNNNPPK
jgi:hypothetical protein